MWQYHIREVKYWETTYHRHYSNMPLMYFLDNLQDILINEFNNSINAIVYWPMKWFYNYCSRLKNVSHNSVKWFCVLLIPTTSLRWSQIEEVKLLCLSWYQCPSQLPEYPELLGQTHLLYTYSYQLIISFPTGAVVKNDIPLKLISYSNLKLSYGIRLSTSRSK